jgi:hypothetical protein
MIRMIEEEISVAARGRRLVEWGRDEMMTAEWKVVWYF